MRPNTAFTAFEPSGKTSCLRLFDENCPKYFAPNERNDYENFLDENPIGYELCTLDSSVVGAYGLIGGSLNWILLSPQVQGIGLGSNIMNRALERAIEEKLACIDIAASHLSEGFFARYGAVKISELDDGWGPGMHRVDMELRT
ncbi:MAG: hypothetical protein AB8B86_13455 [Pseudomonadales bacterium]